jgi:peptide/nickel transport system permease protein
MASKIGPTAELAIFSMFLSVCIAIPVGVLSALTYRGALDRVLMTFGTAAIAVPNFWLAIVLIMIFSQWLNWLPAGGRVSSFFEDPITGIKQLFLPGLTLALYTAAIQMRFIRASMLEVLSHDYIRTARAKGLSEATIVIKHALRNSLLPFLTVAGVQFGYLLAGALIVENVFAWPGLGQLVLSGIRNRDYQLVQGCLLLFVFIVVSINLLIDILYHLVDPRTASRVGRKNAS